MIVVPFRIKRFFFFETERRLQILGNSPRSSQPPKFDRTRATEYKPTALGVFRTREHLLGYMFRRRIIPPAFIYTTNDGVVNTLTTDRRPNSPSKLAREFSPTVNGVIIRVTFNRPWFGDRRPSVHNK